MKSREYRFRPAFLASSMASPIYPAHPPSRRKSKAVARSRPRSNSDHLLLPRLVFFFFSFYLYSKRETIRALEKVEVKIARGEERNWDSHLWIKIWTTWLHIHDMRFDIFVEILFLSFFIPLLFWHFAFNLTWKNCARDGLQDGRKLINFSIKHFSNRFAINNFEKYFENIFFFY